MIERLHERRQQILNQIAGSDLAGFPTNPALRALTAELATIESALIQADNTTAINDAAAQRALEVAQRDDAAFWFRRFILSLQIGNGAALLAALSGALQATDVREAAESIRWATAFFGLGVILAGALPGAIWLQRLSPRGKRAELAFRAAISFLAVGSAVSFVAGVGYIQGHMGAIDPDFHGRQATTRAGDAIRAANLAESPVKP